MNILVIDVGGTHTKVVATGHPNKVKFDSGPALTPAQMVDGVKALTAGWKFDAVSIGYPGPVVKGRPMVEPRHLGPGWKAFNFNKAFGKPVRVINDAAMQALGIYEGGRMLFLGLGTGLGTALIVDHVLLPMELAHLPYKKGRTYEETIGLKGLERSGKKKWRKRVVEIGLALRTALQVDYVVLGGGNARLLDGLPPGLRLGQNSHAFRGGFRLWDKVQNAQYPARTGYRPA